MLSAFVRRHLSRVSVLPSGIDDTDPMGPQLRVLVGEGVGTMERFELPPALGPAGSSTSKKSYRIYIIVDSFVMRGTLRA